MTNRSKLTMLCLMLILLGGGFRFYGLSIGFPFEYHVDEWFITNKTLEMFRLGTLRPPAFDYPSLIYYVLLGGAYLINLVRPPRLYDLYVFGRAVSALFGTATIGIVFLIGKRAYSAGVGLLAAAFFACTVTALRESHYYTTDSLNSFFIVLAVYFIIKVALGDDLGNYLYAAIALGLAAGSKYNGAFLSLPLLFAHFARTAKPGDWKVGSAIKPQLVRLFSPWLIGAALICFAVFLLTTPYALISPHEFLKDLTKMSSALSSKITEGNHSYLNTTPYWYYIRSLLFWAMGPMLEVAALLGFLYALVRHRKQDMIVALWLVIYFAIVGGWLNKAVRYTLPMLPFLALFAAIMFVEGYTILEQRRRRALAWVVAMAGGVTLCATFLYALAYLNIYSHPHTGILAARWTYANIPPGSTIMLEGPTAYERPQVDQPPVLYPDESFDDAAKAYNFKYLPVPNFVPKEIDPASGRREIAAFLDGTDYIIMTTRWYEGLVNSPEASPVIRDYYRELTNGDLGFDLIKEITVYPSVFGFELNDDAAELNFRIFDHPKVLIFKKRPARPFAPLSPVQN